MQSASYTQRRGQLETYFDRTAAEAWSRLTSDTPVSGIRATVRAGRSEMRETLLNWLPIDLRGCRVLDAGCGTGALAVELAKRGADVIAIDIAATLVNLAAERVPANLECGSISFRVGDMLDPSLGRFDHVIAMDSLIHYRSGDMAAIVAQLAAATGRSVLFTFAPQTPALTAMHAVGRLFPRGNRAPAIEPVSPKAISGLLATEAGMNGWRPGRTHRVLTGFYKSQALEMLHA